MAEYTLDSELAWKIMETEGLDYAILYYFGRHIDTDNEAFNIQWAKAFDALSIISTVLQDLQEDGEAPDYEE